MDYLLRGTQYNFPLISSIVNARGFWAIWATLVTLCTFITQIAQIPQVFEGSSVSLRAQGFGSAAQNRNAKSLFSVLVIVIGCG